VDILHQILSRYDIKGFTGIQTQFSRIREKEELLSMCVTTAGCNLSGLSEEPTAFQNFCFHIQKDIEKEDAAKIQGLPD